MNTTPNVGRYRFPLGLFLIVAVAACRYTSGASFNGELPSSATRTETAEIASSMKTLEVDNKFGPVKVTAAETGPFGWKWNLEARAKTDTLAQADLALASLKVETNGDTLRLTLVLPQSNENRQYASGLEMRVPKVSVVRAENHFGTVEITGVDGPVDARSESASVTVHGVRGKVRAQTSFSSLKVEACGPSWLKNQSGDLNASNIHGPLEAETSFSHLNARDIAGSLKARNQSGPLDAEHVQGEADLRTSFASLSATDIAGPLRARDQSGSITARRVKGNADLETSFAELNVEGVEGDAALNNQSGRIKVRDVSGSVEAVTSFAAMDIDGSGRSFVCHNQSGTITLHAKSAELTKIDARTSFAALDLQIPASLKPVVQAHTSFAEVESDFPVILKSSAGKVLAEADGNAPRIALENQSGRIRIQGERN